MNWLSRISCSIALVWTSMPCPWAQSDPLKLTVMDADSIPLTQAMVEVGDQIGFTNDLGEWSVICQGATRLRIVAV